jgi:hypothetical protein
MLKRRNTSIELNLIPIPGSQILDRFFRVVVSEKLKFRIKNQNNLKQFPVPACACCSYPECAAPHSTVQLTADSSR